MVCEVKSFECYCWSVLRGEADAYKEEETWIDAVVDLICRLASQEGSKLSESMYL